VTDCSCREKNIKTEKEKEKEKETFLQHTIEKKKREKEILYHTFAKKRDTHTLNARKNVRKKSNRKKGRIE
jgi:hypothetical protein